MRTSFSDLTMLSFYGWLDHYMLQNAQAYHNETMALFNSADPRLGTGFTTYNAPSRSLVWDSGVSGAVIFNAISGYFFDASHYSGTTGTPPYTSVIFPQVGTTGWSSIPLQFNFGTGGYITVQSGIAVVSGNSVFVPDNLGQTGSIRISGAGGGEYQDIGFSTDGSPTVLLRGANGMMTDFVNGRVIFPSSFGTGFTITGSYSVKDLNLYYANQTNERMVFTDKYYANSRFGQPATGLLPYSMVSPAAFISNAKMENEQRCLGGIYTTRFTIAVDVFAETVGQMDNIMGFMADAKDCVFPMIQTSDWPLNEYGDYKSGYNYTAFAAANTDPTNLFSVTKVVINKASDSIEIDQSIFYGTARFTIEKTRRLR